MTFGKVCERCGSTDEVHSTLREHSYPHPDDAQNTPEQLPFGKGKLCEKCMGEWFTQMDAETASAEVEAYQKAEEAVLKARQAGGLSDADATKLYWQTYFTEYYDLPVEEQDERTS